MSDTPWAVIDRYGFRAVKVARETPSYIFVSPPEGHRIGTRYHAHDVQGRYETEEAAVKVAADLTNARAEYARRNNDARNWYTARRVSILKDGI